MSWAGYKELTELREIWPERLPNYKEQLRRPVLSRNVPSSRNAKRLQWGNKEVLEHWWKMCSYFSLEITFDTRSFGEMALVTEIAYDVSNSAFN